MSSRATPSLTVLMKYLMRRISPNKPSQGFPWLQPPISQQQWFILLCTMAILLSFTLDTAEAPVTIYVVYAPRNMKDQSDRDEFWEQLTDQVHQHERSQPFMVIGDSNAQLLDELQTIQGATGPHLQWENTMAEEEELMANGEGESNHVRFFELIFQKNLCIPQTWMEKQPQYRHTHRRPAGDLVQLNHVVAPIQWRNMITDVAAVPGAALHSNHYLVKIRATLHTTTPPRRTPAQPKRSRKPTRRPSTAVAGGADARPHNAAAATVEQPAPPGHPSPATGGNAATGAGGHAVAITPQSLQGCGRGTHTKGAQSAKATLDHSQHVGVDPETLTGPRGGQRRGGNEAQQRGPQTTRAASIHPQRQRKASQPVQTTATFAEHLANSQWALPSHPYTGSRDSIAPQADVNTDLFTMEELNAALWKAANNKAPRQQGWTTSPRKCGSG